MISFPDEIINYILSFRGPHPCALLIKDHFKYNAYSIKVFSDTYFKIVYLLDANQNVIFYSVLVYI